MSQLRLSNKSPVCCFLVTMQQIPTARSSLLPYDHDVMSVGVWSDHPNIFPLGNSIMPEHLDGHNQQMVNSDMLRLEAISTCSNDLFPCMEWKEWSIAPVDYSRKYFSTRKLSFRELRLSDFERTGLELVLFTADCLFCFMEPISYSRYLLKDTLGMSLSWDFLHPLLGCLVYSFNGRHNIGPACGFMCYSQRHLEDEDSRVFQVRCLACNCCTSGSSLIFPLSHYKIYLFFISSSIPYINNSCAELFMNERMPTSMTG
jgi:hypothetical protein